MSYGIVEVLFLLVLFVWLVPVLVLIAMANNKGRSKHFAWWGVGLGWLGLIIGAVILLTGPDRKSAAQ